MAITTFYELDVPVSDHHSGKIDWCMRVTGGQLYYLLNHTAHLGDLKDYADNEFYFLTESSAHKQASTYYDAHGVKYPYTLEWSMAIVRELDDELEAEDDDGDVVTSQPMEFI